MKNIILEACIGSLEEAKKFIEVDKIKIDRFETCSSLDQGGLTPDIETFDYIEENNIEQVVMIRNANTFDVNEDNIDKLNQDIIDFGNIGAKHFIFGYVTKDKKIDIDTCNKLINTIKLFDNTSWNFHMAIDEVVNYDEAFETLIELGFTRVLTKGGKTPAENNIENLKYLNEKYGKKIQILVGGKVTKDNWEDIYKKTNIKQFHGTKIA